MKKRGLTLAEDLGLTNESLLKLIDNEGVIGYGAYSMLKKLLRRQEDYRFPLELLSSVARQVGVRVNFLVNIIKNYGLFVVDGTEFFSPEVTDFMLRLKMEKLPNKENILQIDDRRKKSQNKSNELNNVKNEVKETRNSLNDSDEFSTYACAKINNISLYKIRERKKEKTAKSPGGTPQIERAAIPNSQQTKDERKKTLPSDAKEPKTSIARSPIARPPINCLCVGQPSIDESSVDQSSIDDHSVGQTCASQPHGNHSCAGQSHGNQSCAHKSCDSRPPTNQSHDGHACDLRPSVGHSCALLHPAEQLYRRPVFDHRLLVNQFFGDQSPGGQSPEERFSSNLVLNERFFDERFFDDRSCCTIVHAIAHAIIHETAYATMLSHYWGNVSHYSDDTSRHSGGVSPYSGCATVRGAPNPPPDRSYTRFGCPFS
ncbi:MAG: hypothetical protein ACK5ND_01550 [Bacteroides sp.]